MTGTFADSFYFLALLNPADAAHVRAHTISGTLRGRIVTTSLVLIELADALCFRDTRSHALDLIHAVRTDPDFNIIPADEKLIERGLDLYARRPDKNWSLTDCASFVVMHDGGLTDALTGDRHFEQAGFNVLLK